jgi:hypothetical protein
LEIPIIFQDQFQGIVPTCELFEAFLHNIDQANATCSLAQQVMSDYCGCSSVDAASAAGEPCLLCPNGASIAFPNKTLDLEGFPLQNCQELDNATKLFLKEGSDTCNLFQSVGTFCGCPAVIEGGCTLCRDGSAATNPLKPVPVLEEQFGFVPTCGLLEAALIGEQPWDARCEGGRLFGSSCGCPPIENHCLFCGEDDNVTLLDKEIPQFQHFTPFTPTCELIESFQYQVAKGSEICRLAFENQWRCGCDGGHSSYLGADTVPKQAVLAWMPRITGLVSTLVSAHCRCARLMTVPLGIA